MNTGDALAAWERASLALVEARASSPPEAWTPDQRAAWVEARHHRHRFLFETAFPPERAEVPS